MNDIPKKRNDYWSIIYIVILVTGFPMLGKLIFSQVNAILISAICGGIGAMIGFGIYKLVAKKNVIVKMIGLLLEIVVLLGSIVLFSWINTDQQQIKRNWLTHNIGNISFQYPTKFQELKLDTNNELCKMRVFSDNHNDRIAMYLVYDFKENPVKMDESLEGSISNALNNIKATDIDYFDVKYTPNTVEKNIKYKIGTKEYIGYGFIYNKENHFELVLFIPITKGFSPEYLDKIKKGVKINQET
jgi:hypothetical protein